MNRIAYVVLAAGSGKRFGGGKLDAALGIKSLGRWVADTIEEAGATDRFIVVSENPPRFTDGLNGWHMLVNRKAEKGIGTSIRTAIEAIREFDRAVFTLADMPFVDAALLRRLGQGEAAMFTRHPDGKPGVPAAFPKTAFTHLQCLANDKGAASLAHLPDTEIIEPVSDALLADIDTKSDLAETAAAMNRARIDAACSGNSHC